MRINELSLREKIGQMIMAGMESNYITPKKKELITQYKVGGIILYRKNFKNYDEMLSLISKLKQLNKPNKIPLFIAIDQEGGRVNRMPKEILNLPSPYKIATNTSIEGVKKSAQIIGKLLKKSGYNLNFAPVMDIKRFADNHAIGDRCYSEDKEEVTKYGLAFMEELQKQGIISVIKHYPGHGATKKDSHFWLPVVKDKIEKIEQEDMYPFKEAIKNGADAILVGHLLVKDVSRKYPASLSKTLISKYLRMKYHYNGLIIADDLKMKAINFIYGTNFAIEKAVEAGNDVIIVRLPKEKQLIEKIESLVKSRKIKEARINRSVIRIIKIKEKYNISDDELSEGVDIEEINEEITELRKKCGL